MAANQPAPRSSAEAKIRLPWFVMVSPEFYDDDHDVGYGWEGWAQGAEEAVAQALEECHRINDREPYFHEEDVDPKRAKVHVAEIDFRAFAGPLMHWAKTGAGRSDPIWQTLEAAVAIAGLQVAPLDMSRSADF